MMTAMNIKSTSKSRTRFNYYADLSSFEIGFNVGKTRWNPFWRYFIGLELGFIGFWIYFGKK